jgi:hypothetical protein
VAAFDGDTMNLPDGEAGRVPLGLGGLGRAQKKKSDAQVGPLGHLTWSPIVYYCQAPGIRVCVHNLRANQVPEVRKTPPVATINAQEEQQRVSELPGATQAVQRNVARRPEGPPHEVRQVLMASPQLLHAPASNLGTQAPMQSMAQSASAAQPHGEGAHSLSGTHRIESAAAGLL